MAKQVGGRVVSQAMERRRREACERSAAVLYSYLLLGARNL